MQKSTKTEQEDRGTKDALTALMQVGTRKLIAQALDDEVAEVLAAYADQQDEQGQAVVVRNGHHLEREIQTGIGPLTVQGPKVPSRRGKPVTTFRSALVPPHVRKAASSWLYFNDISTGEMQAPLESLVGPD